MSDFESVIRLFQAQVAANPEGIAGESPSDTLTYLELDHRSNQLARNLIGRGVSRDDIVAFVSGRNLQMLVGILGVLKAGAAYLPIDPTYPVKRQQFMLDDARPVHLLKGTDKSLDLDLPGRSTCLLTQWNEVEKEPIEQVSIEPRSDDLAYVIYTSGSSGTPKGVLLEHLGLAEMAKAHVRAFSIKQDSRVLQFSSFCFDASVSEIFMSLAGGATICMAEQSQLIPGQELSSLLSEREITNVLLPPSALALLPVDSLPRLKTLISGGDRCPREIVERWADGRDFFNAYGPTEGTVTAAIHRCSPTFESDPPIGTSREFLDTYVLNESDEPVAENEIGELCIAGNGVARGYLNRPELTAQRFTVDPFGSNQKRMFRTGDLVKRVNGNLFFVGRVDRQVKVRGFRVELGEIESVLNLHPAIEIAAALLREFSNEDKRISAYCKTRADKEVTQKELRVWLESQLPAYAIPSNFYFVEEIPLMPNGKIDYDSLSKIPVSESAGVKSIGSSNSKTMTPNEKMMQEIWCQVIGLSPAELSLDSHFIEVGGDSLLSVQIASKLKQRGINIHTEDLFSYPTIRELTGFIESR